MGQPFQMQLFVNRSSQACKWTIFKNTIKLCSIQDIMDESIKIHVLPFIVPTQLIDEEIHPLDGYCNKYNKQRHQTTSMHVYILCFAPFKCI